eukprot:COSAG02_NODE_1295_length_13400_cov_5.691828_5_plen_67_part_00
MDVCRHLHIIGAIEGGAPGAVQQPSELKLRQAAATNEDNLHISKKFAHRFLWSPPPPALLQAGGWG